MNHQEAVRADVVARIAVMPCVALAILLCLFGSHQASAQNGQITIVKAVPTPTTQNFSFYAWGANSGCCMPVQIAGSNVAPTNQHTWSLPAGTYSWEEDFNNPTPNPGWMVQSISCLPAGSVTVDLPNRAFTAQLAAGQHITCTYNNAPTPGTITIVKAVPTPTTQNFSFYAFGSNSSCCNPVQIAGSNVAPTNQHSWTLAAGTYSWEEDFANPTPNPGWTVQSISCLPAGSATVDLPNRAFTAHLAAGQHITCTYKNAPTPGTITIVKAVPTPTTQNFSFYAFGSNSSCCTPVQIAGSNVAPSNQHSWALAAGTYSWEEDFVNPTPNPGWTVQSISCLPAGSATVDLPNRAFTAHLAAGQHITCTYSNKPIPPTTGQITIVKVAKPATNQNFSFYAWGSNSSCCTPVQISGSDTAPADQHTWTLPAGTYSWEEDFANPTPNPGWTVQSISCLPAGSATVDLTNRAFTAHLTAGQHIVCTYTNQGSSATGKITIVKAAKPPSSQNFNFYAFGPNSGCCGPVQISGSDTAPGDQHTWTLPAGAYSWKEDFFNPTPVTGWTLDSISCTPAGSATIDMASLSFTANLTANANISCTFTDRQTTASTCGGYPMTADVNIYNPTQPFGPQRVDICSGGNVIFHNVNSGVAWTIDEVSGPAIFSPIPVATSPSTASTGSLTTAGGYEYKIDGANPILVHGYITVH